MVAVVIGLIVLVVIILVRRLREDDEETEMRSTSLSKQRYSGLPSSFDKTVLKYMNELDEYIETGIKGSPECIHTLNQFQKYIDDTYKRTNYDTYKNYKTIYDAYHQRLIPKRLNCGTYLYD